MGKCKNVRGRGGELKERAVKRNESNNGKKEKQPNVN